MMAEFFFWPRLFLSFFDVHGAYKSTTRHQNLAEINCSAVPGGCNTCKGSVDRPILTTNPSHKPGYDSDPHGPTPSIADPVLPVKAFHAFSNLQHRLKLRNLALFAGKQREQCPCAGHAHLVRGLPNGRQRWSHEGRFRLIITAND